MCQDLELKTVEEREDFFDALFGVLTRYNPNFRKVDPSVQITPYGEESDMVDRDDGYGTRNSGKARTPVAGYKEGNTRKSGAKRSSVKALKAAGVLSAREPGLRELGLVSDEDEVEHDSHSHNSEGSNLGAGGGSAGGGAGGLAGGMLGLSLWSKHKVKAAPTGSSNGDSGRATPTEMDIDHDMPLSAIYHGPTSLDAGGKHASGEFQAVNPYTIPNIDPPPTTLQSNADTGGTPKRKMSFDVFSASAAGNTAVDISKSSSSENHQHNPSLDVVVKTGHKPSRSIVGVAGFLGIAITPGKQEAAPVTPTGDSAAGSVGSQSAQRASKMLSEMQMKKHNLGNGLVATSGSVAGGGEAAAEGRVSATRALAMEHESFRRRLQQGKAARRQLRTGRSMTLNDVEKRALEAVTEQRGDEGQEDNDTEVSKSKSSSASVTDPVNPTSS